MFAYYSSPGDEIGAAIINWAIVISAVLNAILFFRLLEMTKDVKELKNKLCSGRLYSYQLHRKLLELKYTGKVDEAKKVLDENLANEVFAKVFVYDKLLEHTQQETVEKIIREYERYYRFLDCEMPTDIKNIDIERVKREFSSL